MELAMERRSGLVMPTIGYELDREEMSYVDGGLFLGVGVSASVAVMFYNLINSTALKSAAGVKAY